MSTSSANSSKRLASLDAVRGFDMLFIAGLTPLLAAICKLFPNGTESWIYQQMLHADWNGFTHYDTIFPLFIFIAGISFPFSYAKMQEKSLPRWKIYWKIFRWALILVLFRLICNGLLKCQFANLRYWSVLARIGVSWMFAALLFINFKPGVRAVVSAVILIGYWLLLSLVTAPDAPAGAGSLSLEGNIVGYIDRCLFPGHLYSGTGGIFDPEGTLSTLPAIVTAMLGMFTGEWVQRKDLSENKKTLWMLLAAVLMLVIGLIWSKWFPLNKKLWTSSFVLVAAAYSLGLFALFYWIIDVKGWKGWILPLVVVGMNSITIFMAPRIIDFKYATDFFLAGVRSLLPAEWGYLLWRVGYLALIWLFLYFLYRKKIFLKV